jgi:TPR repeat protein
LKYNNGQGVTQDYVEAVRYFRKAADAGRDTAQFNLGLRYYNRQGVPQDYVQAHMWINLAAAYRFSCGSGVDDEEKCAAILDKVAARMTSAQITDAERLAREWKPKSQK